VVAGLSDLMRGSILVDRADQVMGANAAILKAFAPDSRTQASSTDSERHYTGAGVQITINDRFMSPTPAGYSDVQFKVEVTPGHFAELQVHIPEMLAAKEGDEVKAMGVPEQYWPENLNIEGLDPANPGHKLFEKARSLKKEDLVRIHLDSLMRELYTAALWAAANAGNLTPTRRKASSLSSGLTQASSAPTGGPKPGTTPPGNTSQALPSNVATSLPLSLSQNSALAGISSMGIRSSFIANYPKAAPTRNKGVTITAASIHQHTAAVDLSALKGRGAQWRKVLKEADGMEVVPLSQLVSRKDEQTSPRLRKLGVRSTISRRKDPISMNTPPAKPNYLPPTTTATRPLKPFHPDAVRIVNENWGRKIKDMPVIPDDAPLYGLPLPPDR
jgi:hypothetical protein